MTERSRIRRPRRPPPQAPQRYPGQGGALLRQPSDPIPQWRYGAIAAPIEERARDAARQREIAAAMPRGQVVAPPMPGLAEQRDLSPPPVAAERVRFASLQGDYPANGTAGDWIAGPQRLPPRGALFVGPEADAEPWRSPVTTDRMMQGQPAIRRGMEPASAGVLNRQGGSMGASPIMAEDDLDAQFRAARARAQGALSRQPDPTGMRAAAQQEINDTRARELERLRRQQFPLRR